MPHTDVPGEKKIIYKKYIKMSVYILRGSAAAKVYVKTAYEGVRGSNCRRKAMAPYQESSEASQWCLQTLS